MNDAAHQNTQLSDNSWNDRENERLKAPHSALGSSKVADAKADAYDKKAELRRVESENPRLSLLEMCKIADARVKQRLAQATVEDNAETEELIARDFKTHAGGGGGTRVSAVVYFRFCDVCDRQWRRSVIPAKSSATGRREIIWTPVCKCNAGYIERRGSAQQQGAKPPSHGSSKSSGRAKPTSKFEIEARRQDKYSAILSDEDPKRDVSDEERSQKAYDQNVSRLAHIDAGSPPPRDFKLPPIFKLFMRQSRGAQTSRTLMVRHILQFFMLTEEYARGDMETWITELTELEENDRWRQPGEVGRPKKFGKVDGIDGKDRLPRELCFTLMQKYNLVVENDLCTGFERRSLTFERASAITLTHLVVWAIATYIWYLIALSKEVDEALSARGLPTNPRRLQNEENFRSSLAECECLTEIIARHDDPTVKRLRKDAARPPRARDILEPFLFRPVSNV